MRLYSRAAYWYALLAAARLQQRREDPHERFGDAAASGAAEPFGRGERMAARLVLFEDGGHARREFPVVDEGVDFEVVFETAEVHVRGADHREHVVDDQQFGVQESRHVEEYLYAGLHHVVEVGVRRQIHDLRIGACGEHQPHVDARQRGLLQRRVEDVGRKVVGGLDPHPPPGAGDGVAVGLQQRPPFAEGAAGDDLHDVVGETRRGGIVFRRGDLLLGAGDARLVQIPVDAAARLLAAGADGLVEGRDLRHAGHLQNSCDFTSILSELLQKSRCEFFKRKRCYKK
mgnify:CR=1 FL=1